jgi:hypothetical protein
MLELCSVLCLPLCKTNFNHRIFTKTSIQRFTLEIYHADIRLCRSMFIDVSNTLHTFEKSGNIQRLCLLLSQTRCSDILQSRTQQLYSEWRMSLSCVVCPCCLSSHLSIHLSQYEVASIMYLLLWQRWRICTPCCIYIIFILCFQSQRPTYHSDEAQSQYLQIQA